MGVAAVKSRMVPAARRGLDLLNAVYDRRRPPDPGIVILAYHRVGGRTPTSVDLPTDVFRAQMELLASSGRVISLDEAVDRLRPPADVYDIPVDDPLHRSIAEQRGEVRIEDLDLPPVEPGVVVTFDDGTADWVDEVLPVLEATGMPATFYVATRFIEEQVPFPNEGTPISWTGLEELDSSELVTLGTHTHNHLLLDRVSPQDAARDIDDSRYLMEERLGQMPLHFAYPKALPGVGVVKLIVKQRFLSAVVAGNRTNTHARDLYRLGRHPVQRRDADLRRFAAKVAGAHRFEGLVRERVLPLRERRSAY